MSRPELVVFSHLPWTWVWQRPQHIVSRLARERRAFYVETPVEGPVGEPTVHISDHGAVRRLRLEVPGEGRRLDFDIPAKARLLEALAAQLGDGGPRTLWLYTPTGLEPGRGLGADLVVYDVMDDLAAFAGVSPALRQATAEAVAAADLVFTGGRSIDASVRALAPERIHLFASGVEPEHYAAARALRPAARPRPVAGYVGVIDERLDLALLAGLARALPHWDLELAGPVADWKFDPGQLPAAPNLRFTGMQPYERLPAVMAGFDVALMPFALNAATRSISPTKTLEYLAAGLPVVSTRVPDVVADFGAVVDLRDDAEGFAAGCEAARARPAVVSAEADALVAASTWDAIVGRMAALMGERTASSGAR